MTATEARAAPAEDAKEAAIINAARKAFLARGFDAASMDAIALMAGVSKRTVYNRFRSKEELFAAAIMETCRRILPVEMESIEATLAPEEFIREMSRRFLHGVIEPEALALRRIATFEAPRTPALGKAYLRYGPRFLVDACVPVLERLVARGALKINDKERAIWQLGAMLTEPLVIDVLLGEPPLDLEAAIESQIDSAVSAFMKLYGA
ncbi:MAG TPA: TetR/AcrR family transcriptional regulator [Parvularculaceae bacterium]|nr:TetR/AcrR family transcriptional regulator [Parvularculaceae bacterium]